MQKVIDANMKYLPRGATVTLRGQVVTMNTAFSGLFFGLLAAIVLIYLLIVVNFQSWLDPFVIITALPAALAGIVWMLFATGTTLSVPALTGAIMCMGVATANSILVVSFARERLAITAMRCWRRVEAGFTRFRPVLMTALAMMIGMAPMALGLGEGGEQNAPLGRAVIGGPGIRHLRHPDVRAGGIQHHAWPARGQCRGQRPAKSPAWGPEKLMPDKNPDAGPTMPSRTIPAPYRAAAAEVLGRDRAVVVAVVIAVLGIGWRLWKSHTTAQWTEDQAVPRSRSSSCQGTKTGGVLDLPGDVEAFTNAPIYAQVTGYRAEMVFRYRRQGEERRSAGPDRSQALSGGAGPGQGRAGARQRHAWPMPRSIWPAIRRWRTQNAISKQQLATQQATVNSDAGVVEADRARCPDRRNQSGLYPHHRAVRRRGHQPLGGCGQSGDGRHGLRHAAVHRHRPEQAAHLCAHAADLRVLCAARDMAVTFTVPQYPNRIFHRDAGRQCRRGRQATGTVLIQFRIDNSDHALQPGDYANVRFPAAAGANGIRLPATALMFRDDGMLVATVDAGNHVRLKTVNILRDLGASVDVSGGITPSDRIIDNPADALQEGDEVRIANR